MAKQCKKIYDELEARLNELNINVSQTERCIGEEKRRLRRNCGKGLEQWLDKAEDICLNDLREQKDLIEEKIVDLQEENEKLYKKYTRKNAADVDIEANISQLRSKVKFPYHLSLFKRLVELRGEIGISESCGSKRCKTCKHMNETNIFTSTVTGKIFIIEQTMNCKTKNVIYLVTCSCKKQYVGMTVRSLCKRIGEHRRKGSVFDHVEDSDHTFDVIAIDTDEKWKPKELRAKEKYWIQKLKPGLNKRH